MPGPEHGAAQYHEPGDAVKYMNLTGAPAPPEADGGDGGGFFSAFAASSKRSTISEPNWISGRSDRMDLYRLGPPSCSNNCTM